MDITESPRRWWVLAALALTLITYGLDTTILNVALPTLATDLHAGTSALQWFSNSFTLALAAVLLPAGFLGDRFGPKTLLVAGLATFGLGSAACAVSDTAGQLIAARAVLGVGAAFMVPLSAVVLTSVFTPQERPRALAVYATAMSAGIPLGPILGGVLLQHFAWGSVFLINVPLALVGVVAISVLVPRIPGNGAGRMDLPALVLSAGGLTSLTYGLVRVGSDGWADTRAVVMIVAGVVLLAVLVVWERRATHPLVDLALFRSRGFTGGTALAALSTFVLMGALFVLPQFFSAVMGADALGSGLRLLPMIGGLLVGTTVGSRVRARIGGRATVVAGFGLMAIGLVLGSMTSATGSLGSFGYVAGWSALIGAALGFIMPVTMDFALGALTKGRMAAGSALSQALRQVGGTLGVAVLGSVLSAAYRARVDDLGLPADLASRARESGEAGVGVASAAAPDLVAPVRAAFAHGMGVMLLVAAGVSVVAAAIAVRYLPRRADDLPEAAEQNAEQPPVLTPSLPSSP